MASGRIHVGHEKGINMSGDEKKQNMNIIRYTAIGVIAVVVILALILLILTYLGENDNIVGEFQTSIRIDANGESVYVYHEGGDLLEMNRIQASIDGFNVAPGRITLLSSRGLHFVPGDVIGIETVGYERPSTLILWYTEAKGAKELARAELAPFSTTPVTPTQTQYSTNTHPVQTEIITAEVTQIVVNEQNPADDSETGIVQLWPQETKVTPTPTLEPLVSDVTFEISTNSGEQPLTVQFKDTTEECAATHLWEFGDGEESTDRFTSHTYIYPGTYTATLSVTFCNEYKSPAASEQIHVEPITREDGYVTGFKGAIILPGGMLNFIVKNNVGLRVGGRLYTLQENDAVKIELISSGNGAITVIGNVIVDLVLPESILSINGEEIAKGSVIQTTGIQFSNLAVSELSLHIAPGQSTEINGAINGYNVISPNMEYGYFIHNIGPDSTGKMIVDAREQKFVLQAGIKGITQITSV
jgi:hypothetical protein